MTRRIASTKGSKLKCDRLFSQIIRTRDKRCRNCGHSENLQCAHIASRRFSAGRTNEQNAVALCAGCHHFFTDNPVAFGVWVISWMGEPAYVALQHRVNRVTKMDWPAEAERLQERLNELELFDWRTA